ncbi:MAG: hypothetical protein WBE76_23400 [Terracidiphilus sp.]
MRISRASAVLGFVSVLVAACAFAQPATGIYPYGAFDNRGFDTIDLGNLNVHFSIPVVNKAGRVTPFYYNLVYDSLVWYPLTSGSTTTWKPVTGWGWHGDTEVAFGYMTFATIGTTNSHFVYHDSLGVSHSFPGVTTTPTSPTASGSSIDGSGLTLSVTGQTDCAISTPTGASIAVPNTNNGPATYTDPNGNQISVNSSGQFTDTLGTVALTISGTNPQTYTYTNPSGGTSAIKMYYAVYTVATDFGDPNISEYPRTAVDLVTSVNLPNGVDYKFTYEQLPTSECTPLGGTNGTNCLTGRIASVLLSTGGTITYSYVGGYKGILSDGSTAGLTRNDGKNWSYGKTMISSQNPGPGVISETTKTDPSGNKTVYTFSQDDGGTNNLYPTEIQYNQGSSTLLSTVIQCFNAYNPGGYDNCGGEVVTTPIFQIDTYTQFPSGMTRLSELLYDDYKGVTYGNVTTDREFDYGVTLNQAPIITSGPPLIRETDMTYNYPTGQNGVFSELATSTTNDWSSGTEKEIAYTSYQYDTKTLATPPGNTPLQWISVSTTRGNLTQVSYSTGSTTLNA